jgi:AraC-like DNA-binding protein
MARKKKPVLTPTPMIPPLIRWARGRGVDVARLSARFGLSAGVESEEQALFDPERFEELLAALADELGDPFLGLHLPAALEWKRYTMAELAARAAPTVREALERVVRFGSAFYAHLVFGLEDRGDEVVFTHRLRGAPAPGMHGNEYALASSLMHTQRLVSAPIKVRRVWFMHRRRGDLGELERFFGTREIGFGARENALVYDARLMSEQLRTGDARMLATVEELAAEEQRARPAPSDFAATVAARVGRALESGRPRLESVSKQLRMSPRTLARRLSDEGTSFKAVVESVQRELACRFARDPAIPLGEVAYRVGFADPATFHRAFKRWTGLTPGEFRRG